MNIIDISGVNVEQAETNKENSNCHKCCGTEIPIGSNLADQIVDGCMGCFSSEGDERCGYPCHGGQLFPPVPPDPMILPNPADLIPTTSLNPFIHREKSSQSLDELFETLLNIPDVGMVKTEINEETNVIITVKSTVEGTCCHKCGRNIFKAYGYGRELLLRHLSVFGRKTYIRIRPPRYQCIYCEGNPVTTQTSSWHDQRSPHTIAYEEYILLQLVNSTVEDVSIKEGLGYEAVMGILNRRIDTKINWDEIERIDVLGLDEISLKKGHRDFVTIVTALIGGEVTILAVLGDRTKKTVMKFLETIPKRLRNKVAAVCSDMYEGFINPAKEVFKKRTKIVVDRFHVACLYRKDLDGLRKKEMKRLKEELTEEEYKKLKGAMWALRKKAKELTEEEREALKCLFGHSPELEMAYILCNDLTDIFNENITKSEAKHRIGVWKIQVRLSGLKCFDKFLTTLEKWYEEITNYFINRQTSGFVEGLNNKIKTIKRRCYGILNIRHLFQRIFLDLEGYSLLA